METVAAIRTAATNAIWGEQKTDEPISGTQGDVTKGEPYDAGNLAEPENNTSIGKNALDSGLTGNTSTAGHSSALGSTGHSSTLGSTGNSSTLGSTGNSSTLDNTSTLGHTTTGHTSSLGNNITKDNTSSLDNSSSLGHTSTRDNTSTLGNNNTSHLSTQTTKDDPTSSNPNHLAEGEFPHEVLRSHDTPKDKPLEYHGGVPEVHSANLDGEDDIAPTKNHSEATEKTSEATKNHIGEPNEKAERIGDDAPEKHRGTNPPTTSKTLNDHPPLHPGEKAPEGLEASGKINLKDGTQASEKPEADPSLEKNRSEVDTTGANPRPVEKAAVSNAGDAGRSSGAAPGAGAGVLPGAGAGAAGEGIEKESHGEGTGEKYVKSTGLKSDGGDFDASAPGAGREADRLLEEKGIHRDDPNHASTTTEGAAAAGTSEPTGRVSSEESHSGKPSLKEKIKAKLHKH